MSEPKYVHRFPPCPAYDMTGQEAWLEAMAAKGLVLTGDGLFCGFACFEQTAPKRIRYRLQPARQGTLFKDGGPDAAVVELAEEFGWKHLANHGEYGIFCTEDPNARELDTDPQVRAMALRKTYRRKLGCFWFLVLFGLALLAFVLWGGILTYWLNAPSGYNALILLIWVTSFWLLLRELCYLKDLRQHLALGEMPERTLPTKKQALLHRLTSAMSLLLLLSFFTMQLVHVFVDWQDPRWVPVSDSYGSLPFPTMEDL